MKTDRGRVRVRVGDVLREKETDRERESVITEARFTELSP